MIALDIAMLSATFDVMSVPGQYTDALIISGWEGNPFYSTRAYSYGVDKLIMEIDGHKYVQ